MHKHEQKARGPRARKATTQMPKPAPSRSEAKTERAQNKPRPGAQRNAPAAKEQLIRQTGTWCSGITSASHAEGRGFNLQWCPRSQTASRCNNAPAQAYTTATAATLPDTQLCQAPSRWPNASVVPASAPGCVRSADSCCWAAPCHTTGNKSRHHWNGAHG